MAELLGNIRAELRVMAVFKGSRDVEDRLNDSMPAAADVKLGTLLVELLTAFNALLAKLDSNHAAATDHAATLAVKALNKR